MLHLESFLDEITEFEEIFIVSNQQVTISKHDILKLITLMKISNSLEVIADSLSADMNDGGVTEQLMLIKRNIDNLNN